MRTVLLLALALATSAALAQESPSSDPGPISTDRADKAGTSVGDRPPFDDLDTDNDGFLSRAELQHDNEFLSRFARWDTDRDERLSMAEYDASAIVDAE
jgi:hypothetical protein